MARQKLQSVTLNPADLAALVQAAIQSELAKLGAQQAPKPEREDQIRAKAANANGHLNLEEPCRDGTTFPAPAPKAIMRDSWLETAGEKLVQIGGKDGPCVVAQPKVFSQGAGAVGWYAQSGIGIEVEGRHFQCTLTFNLTVKNSDPRSKEAKHEIALSNARKMLAEASIQ